MIKVVLLVVLGMAALRVSSDGQTITPQDSGTSIDSECPELPFNSFPPNQLLREETSDGNALSVLKATTPQSWCEFFIEVDRPGTYHLEIKDSCGPDKGIFQTVVDGEPIGASIDLYAPAEGQTSKASVGDVTFLKPGNYSFRFVVTGKNSSSNGYAIALQKIFLNPTEGFRLLSPNGSCEPNGNVLLRWNAWPGAERYRVELDGATIAELDAPATSYMSTNLSPGTHRWKVMCLGANKEATSSNCFAFIVGDPTLYPFREFNDDFSSARQNDWLLKGMTFGKSPQLGLDAKGPGSALVNNVRLEKAEGEVSARVTPGDSDSMAGVGFQASDGTQLYAVLDGKKAQFRIERRVKGYSIFDVTPKLYQVHGWAERTEGDATIWEIAAQPFISHPGASYLVKLDFSRRSACVMATLQPSDGSPSVIVRDISDLRTPDQPLLVSLSGQTHFDDFVFKHLNKQVYKWDPDSFRIVMRPGGPGSWDERGAFNPAIIVHDGKWFMVYRGNAVPAPPNGPPRSDLGLATSTDGIHWMKSPANPIIRRQESRGSREDPDLLWMPDEQKVCLEYVILSPSPVREVMSSSSDWIHWSDPWVLNTGKTWGKIGGMIDLRAGLGSPGIAFQGTDYPYMAMIEEGRIDFSKDLHTWVKAGHADLAGRPNWWCNSHECSGDIFVDADHNIRYESQAGVINGKQVIVGNRLCTIVEGVLSGTDPTKVLWRSDLPWLPDWYGDAPTGSREDFTAPNGSVFPGQTIIKDNWLWHFSGGNNTFTVLSKCWYGPLFEYRNLQTKMDSTHQCSVSVVVRNIGSLKGSGQAVIALDGHPISNQDIALDRDTETTLHCTVSIPAGNHTIAINDVSESVGY